MVNVYFTANMRRCMFLFSLVIVVVCAQTSTPPITLVGNKSKKELHCVIANDTSHSAITFVGQDIIDETKYELPKNICEENGDPFGCFKSTGQNHKNMDKQNSFAGYVLDRRWEGFRTQKTLGEYKFSDVVGIPNGNFTLAFSVRLKENGHILLCDARYPPNSTCYWLILEGWTNQKTKTAIRRCENDVPTKVHVSPKNCDIAEKYISGLISETKWSHFRIEIKAGVVSLYKYGEDDPILTYTDKQPIQLGYLSFRSPGYQGLWKIHQYNFMEVTGDMTITTTSPHLPISSYGVCVAVYLKLCSSCKADIALLKDKSTLTLISMTTANAKEDRWTEIQLKTNDAHPDDQFTIQIKASQTSGEKWYLGEMFVCEPNGIRKITTDHKNAEKDICCHVIKSGEKICTKESFDKLSSSPTPERDCPPNTIGRDCIPCDLFGGCDYYKYCEFESDTQTQCHCPRGFMFSDCSRMCAPGKYGDLCTQTCDRCAFESKCSHINGRCQDGCKNNLLGEFCESYDKPVLKHSPEVISVGHTNVTLKINPDYDGKVAPTFFNIQLKAFNGNWMDVKSEQFSTQTKWVNIDNLKSETFYSVRILLKPIDGDVYGEEIPTTNFTTTCIELAPETINVIVKGQSISVVDKGSQETCNMKNYRYDVGYKLPINHTIPHLSTCALNNIIIINIKSKHSFNFSVKAGENNNDPIQCVNFEVTHNSAILKWDYHGDNKVKYQISYQAKKQVMNCIHNYDSEWKISSTVAITNATLNNLRPYTTYIAMVTPIREDNGKHEQSKTIEFKTTASEILREESIKLLPIQNNNQLNVNAQLEDCTKVTGPIDFTLELKCESAWCVMDTPQMHKEISFVFDKRFQFSITGLTNYSLLSTIRRNSSEKKQPPLRFTSNETAPGPVLDPVIYSKTDQGMSLRWKPPSPPMGKLKNYYIQQSTPGYIYGTNTKNKYCSPKECKLYPGYHCCSINDLSSNGEYILQICALNEKPDICGPGIEMKGKPGQAKPDSPAYLHFSWENNTNLTLEFPHPRITNGPLTSYSVFIDGTEYTTNISEELPIYTRKIPNIKHAKVVKVRVSVSNSAGTSDFVQKVTTSPPPTPGPPKVLNIEATNLTISIPTFKRRSEVTCSLLVFVIDKQCTGGPTGKEKRIFEDYGIDNYGHRSWIAVDTTLNDTEDDWKIVIGTANISESIHTRENIHNYKLTPDTEYKMIIIITTTFRNVTRIEIYPITEKTIFLPYTQENLYFLTLLIVPVICVICFIILRKKGIQMALLKKNSSINTGVIIDDWPLTPTSNNCDAGLHNKAPAIESSPYSRPIKIAQFEKYIKTLFEKDNFEEQFETIAQGKTKPWAIGSKSQNQKKNRDANIIAYDHTRVILKVERNTSDYINASYIKGCNGDKTYIAAQAPMLNTLNHFWRMIWQENVEYVIVLATELEMKQKVITMYWPDKRDARVLYDDIEVHCTNIVAYRNLEERTFALVYNGERKMVTHYHFLSWSTNNIFSYIPCLTSFLRHTLGIVKEASPILVHCTDGVGRTGIFIHAHICLQTATTSDEIDILYELYKLREQRVNMVNPVEGYKLVHLLLLRSLVVPKTDLNCNSEITDSITTLLESPELKNQISYIEGTMWQDKFILSIEKRTSSAGKQNVINENNYVYIETHNVQGYRTPEKFIVTPYPLNNMTEEFWQIILQRNIRTIICLNELLEADKLNPFYPNDDQPIIKLESGIELHSISSNDKNALRSYHIKIITNDESRKPIDVMLIQFKDWFYNILCPTDMNGFLTLINDLNAIDNNNEPIIIACRDGIRASGLFTAMYFLIQQIKCESRLDVPLAVRVVKLSKKEFIRELAQFKFLYRCSLQYLRMFDTYANYTDLFTVSLGDDTTV